MKKSLYLSLLVFVFTCFSQLAHAELLITKKETGKFIPLDPTALTDEQAQAISAIILKYQWPMCIASDLTEEEQEALFAPEEGAEERFIENKIRQALGSDDYHVFFVPTTLYEILCIIELQKTDNNPLRIATKASLCLSLQEFIRQDNSSRLTDTLLETLNEIDSHKKVREIFFGKYKKINNLFFTPEKQNAYLHMNRTLGQYILHETGETEVASNLSNQIKNKACDLALKALACCPIFNLMETESIRNIYPTVTEMLQIGITCTNVNHEVFEYSAFIKIKELLKDPAKRVSLNNCINQVITVEYQARAHNNSPLIRGTKFMRHAVSLPRANGYSEERILAGSSLQEGSTAPYSTCFGYSLFAGLFISSGGCALGYLLKRGTGCAIEINKKEYIESFCNRLFFLPPLGTLSSLSCYGEFFHPRTTAAIDEKPKNTVQKNEPINVVGVETGLLSDTSGTVLITRNHLFHAELFSEYLGKHGHIVIANDKFVEIKDAFEAEIMQSQLYAAAFYRAVRMFNKTLRKAPVKHRTKKSALVCPKTDEPLNMLNNIISTHTLVQAHQSNKLQREEV